MDRRRFLLTSLARYGNKLTADQKKDLKAYWRRIEGGGAA
jgi:hypothetical protein